MPTSRTHIPNLYQIETSLNRAKSHAEQLVEADKPEAVDITIPTTGWVSDTGAAYPYYYDISVSGITVYDRADVVIAPASLATVSACGLCPTSETLAGKIRIRSTIVPTAAISAQYWISVGKHPTS